MNIRILFFKRNVKKFLNIIVSLIFFIFIFNCILGFVLSVTDNYKLDVVDNSNLYFMGVTNKDLGYKFEDETINKISKIDGVKGVFVDYGKGVTICKENKSAKSFASLIAVPKDLLQFFSIDYNTNDDKYFYLNESCEGAEKFNSNEKVTFQGSLMTVKDNKGISKSFTFDGEITNIVKIPELLFFPPDISIIDEETFNKNFKVENNGLIAVKIMVICPSVERMDTVSASIKKIDKNFTVNYSLKTTKNLPKFAVGIITISSIILLVILIITILNVSSSMKQLLISRNRDIGLLYILGVTNSKIYKQFITEFFLNGCITFITSFVATVIMNLLLVNLVKVDLLSKHYINFLGLDFVIAIGIFVLIGFLRLKILLNKLKDGSFYKEILK